MRLEESRAFKHCDVETVFSNPFQVKLDCAANYCLKIDLLFSVSFVKC